MPPRSTRCGVPPSGARYSTYAVPSATVKSSARPPGSQPMSRTARSTDGDTAIPGPPRGPVTYACIGCTWLSPSLCKYATCVPSGANNGSCSRDADAPSGRSRAAATSMRCAVASSASLSTAVAACTYASVAPSGENDNVDSASPYVTLPSPGVSSRALPPGSGCSQTRADRAAPCANAGSLPTR